jgi:hypothetical protein
MVNGVGQQMSAADGAKAFSKLNNLLDQWVSESLMLYAEVRTTFTIVANQASYTVGTGADVNVARPVYLNWSSFVDTSQNPDLEIPLTPLTDQAYASIALKALTSTLPTAFYYNLTHPTATWIPYPIPTRSDLLGVIYARTQVSEFASLDTVVSLPPGWRRMLVSNLAVECAPAFEREPSPQLMKIATESKATVKRSNMRLMDANIDAGALLGTGRRYSSFYDFLAGTF